MKPETKYKILFPKLAIIAGFTLGVLTLTFPHELGLIFTIVALTSSFFTTFFGSFRSKYIKTKDPNEFAKKMMRIMYGKLIYLIFVFVGIMIIGIFNFTYSFIADLIGLPLSEIESKSNIYVLLIFTGYVLINAFIIIFLIQIFQWWKKVLLPNKVNYINVKSLKVLNN